MSHWQEGKAELDCTLEVLRRALLNIMPHWEEYLETDPNGGIDLYTYTGQLSQRGYHLMVPGSGRPNTKGAPDISYNDFGLKQNEKGSWTFQIDPAGMSDPNLIGTLTQEVASMRVKAIEMARNAQAISDEMEGTDRVITFREEIPEEFVMA